MSEVATYYLEMTSPDDIQGKPKPNGLDVVEAKVKDYRFNRFLYQLVGEPWDWTDKLGIPDEDWEEYAESDEVRTWVAYKQGAIAGYFELQKQDDGDVEIRYFGLAPKFLGQGLGGYLLTETLRSAWAWEGTERVWVHTCSLDHDSALQNYKARGMKVYRTEIDKS